MTGKDIRKVKDCVEQEGFEYTFMHYSTFSEIGDDQFHKLRRAYQRAAFELAEYIGVEV